MRRSLLFITVGIFGALWHQNRQLRRENARLAEQATHDPLTGLLNRRGWHDALERCLAQADRAGVPVSLVLLDVDGFKPFNDRYGHAAGDAVLQSVTAQLQGLARRYDALARLGGDEIAVLLPGCTQAQALEIASRMLRVDRPVSSNLPAITLSAGVATSQPLIGRSRWLGTELMATADAALYRAKRRGRGQVVAGGLAGTRTQDAGEHVAAGKPQTERVDHALRDSEPTQAAPRLSSHAPREAASHRQPGGTHRPCARGRP